MLSAHFSAAVWRGAALVALAAAALLVSTGPLARPEPGGTILATTRAAAHAGETHAAHSQTADQYTWDAASIDWFYNPAGGPPGSGSWAPHIVNAAGAWNALSTGAPSLGSGAPGDATTDACDLDADGRNTIGWAALPKDYLARTCIIYGERRDDGTLTVAEFDIQVNWHPGDPGFVPWTTGSDTKAFDFETVILHELGHALGLDHAVACPGAIMCPIIIMGQPQRTPAQADADALADAYSGTTSASNTISLARGWSLVTWTGGATSAAEAITGSDVTAIFAFDPASGAWLHYAPGAPEYVNSLTELRDGQAYWIVSAAQTTLQLKR